MAQYVPGVQRIVNRGKLIIAVHKVDQPPFFMIDKDGNFVELDIDITKDIVAKPALKVKLNRTSWRILL